jgi:hypothetical protein
LPGDLEPVANACKPVICRNYDRKKSVLTGSHSEGSVTQETIGTFALPAAPKQGRWQAAENQASC